MLKRELIGEMLGPQQIQGLGSERESLRLHCHGLSKEVYNTAHMSGECSHCMSLKLCAVWQICMKHLVVSRNNNNVRFHCELN